MGIAVTSAWAQEEDRDPCELVDNKKALKFYEAGTNKKKYGKYERLESLKKALEEEPDFAHAHYALALEKIKTARAKGTSFRSAERSLEEVVRICPDFHYDVYYYLGAIALGRQDYAKTVQYYDEYFNLTGATNDQLNERREEEIALDYEFAKFYNDYYSNPVPFDPKPVPKVNTAQDEFLPFIAPDNEVIYYTRRQPHASQVKGTSISYDRQHFVERFSSSRFNGGQFELGQPLPEPFNAEDAYHYGGATITVDNKHIYMTICVPTRNKSGKTYNNCDIYSTDYVFGFNEKTGANEWHWTPLENMGPNINTESGWEAQPSVTADGRFLYFASARLESKAIDIYYSEKKNGVWGEAVNVGPPINTERNDKTPFIHSDSRTLYFSSDGHLGFGKYDVFFARQGDDGQWEKPKNLGHPINTAEDEHGFVVSTNGSRVYFSSDKLKDQRGGKLDLFYFNLYKEARPDSVVVLKGAITNEANQPLSKAVVEVKNMKTKAIQKIAVDSVDGKFAAVVRLKKGEDMVMNVKAKDRAFSSQLITAKEEKGAPQTTRKLDVKLETLKVGKSYKLNDIYYATNSADLSQKSTLILDEFSQYLRENPTLKIEIHGHTDNVGNDQSNLVLSTERAFSVLDYLQQQGVSKDQIVKWRGFGETRPVASNDHPLGRSQNRRTEFLIVAR